MYLYPNRHSVIMIMIPLKIVFIDLIYYCKRFIVEIYFACQFFALINFCHPRHRIKFKQTKIYLLCIKYSLALVPNQIV